MFFVRSYLQEKYVEKLEKNFCHKNRIFMHMWMQSNGIAENDIIVVENECKDYAYFGDLNARLAIRSGATGVIVDGVTRDKRQTELLGLPVFALGYNAADVRRRATTEYINKPIKIGGHTINPGDLIFMDENAMVVIYKKYEQEILSDVLNTLKNEKKYYQ